MSIYSDCSAACEKLIERKKVFTETDVILQAAENGHWTPDDFDGAARKASMVVGTKYRERKLARYGPVIVPGVPEADYARIGGKIVYASVLTGPDEFKTPNGNFPRLMIQDDNLVKQGRRLGTARDDRKPWKDQNLPVVKRLPATAREQELEANLEAAHQRLHEQEAELNRLRAVLAANNPDSPDRIQDLLRAAADRLDEMSHRLSVIEDREERRKQVYDAA